MNWERDGWHIVWLVVWMISFITAVHFFSQSIQIAERHLANDIRATDALMRR